MVKYIIHVNVPKHRFSRLHKMLFDIFDCKCLPRCSRDTQVTITACIDDFTTVAIPYPVMGVARSNGTFTVSSTATIGANGTLQSSFVQATTSATAFSYQRLGLTPSVDVDVADPFKLISTGNAAAGTALLQADFSFIVASDLVGSALMNTSVPTCANVSAMQARLAQYYAGFPYPAAGSTVAAGQQYLSAAITAIGTSCGLNATTVAALANTTGAGLIAMVWATTTAPQTQVSTPGNVPGPLALVASMAKWVAMLSGPSGTFAALAPLGPTAAARLADAAPINAAGIAAALGVAGYSAVDTTLNLTSTGPLSNVAAQYQPWTNIFASNLTGTTNLAVKGATFGVYIIAPGAVDAFLTLNAANPVKTKVRHDTGCLIKLPLPTEPTSRPLVPHLLELQAPLQATPLILVTRAGAQLCSSGIHWRLDNADREPHGCHRCDALLPRPDGQHRRAHRAGCRRLEDSVRARHGQAAQLRLPGTNVRAGHRRRSGGVRCGCHGVLAAYAGNGVHVASVPQRAGVHHGAVRWGVWVGGCGAVPHACRKAPFAEKQLLAPIMSKPVRSHLG
jgi:hypothetical protein